MPDKRYKELASRKQFTEAELKEWEQLNMERAKKLFKDVFAGEKNT